MVNETKRPCTNAFLVDSFVLGSQKRSRKREEQYLPRRKSTLSPTVGQLYKVKYHFLDGKGGEIVHRLPAMCSKNDLEEHLFTFLKQTRPHHYLLNDSNQTWLNENDICTILLFLNLTWRCEYQWEDKILFCFMCMFLIFSMGIQVRFESSPLCI